MRTLNAQPTLALEIHPTRDPLAALAALPGAFALRSSLPDAGARFRQARWTLFGADPFEMFRGGEHDLPGRFRRLAQTVAPPEAASSLDIPFTGGAVGYWAYDYGRRLERLPQLARDDMQLPDRVVGLYDVTGAHDHDTGRTWVFSTGLPADGDARAARARERLGQFCSRLGRTRRRRGLAHLLLAGTARSAAGYRRAVDDVRVPSVVATSSKPTSRSAGTCR
jgi:para-aminobenzoate synthetase component 1